MKIKKMYSMNQLQIDYIKEQAEKLQIAESDYLRRLIDKHMETEYQKTNYCPVRNPSKLYDDPQISENIQGKTNISLPITITNPITDNTLKKY